MKKITLILLSVVIFVMMAATIVEKCYGTPFVGEHIYGSWWFVALWTLLTISGCAYAVKMKLYRRTSLALLHGSFIIILIGAATTFFTAQRGTVHLRMGMQTKFSAFVDQNDKVQDLPFKLEVKSFRMECYPGTDAPLDYISNVVVNDNGKSETMQISMNHIGQYKGYRFYQSAYDGDMQGTILGVAHDPWGIGITYIGYLLLLISIIWVLLSKHARIRQLYRDAAGARKAVVLALLVCCSITANASENHHVLSEERADNIGEWLVLYNGRVCPINTLATDFVTKLSGKATWDGLSANEVYTGWMFYFSYWEDEKVIRIKDKEAQKALGLDSQWASFNDFWNEYNEYKLEKPLKDAYQNGDEKVMKHLRDADEKFNLIRMFYNGELLRIFPYSLKKGQLQWFAPGTRELPKQMKTDEWFFVRKSLDYLTESIMTKDDATANMLIDKIGKYQRKRGGDFLPSENRVKAELTYNSMQSQRWPVFLALTMGILIFAICFMKERRWVPVACNIWLGCLFAWLTVLLGLRWYVSQHMPLSNGFETMQFMAWAMIVLTLCMQHKFQIIRAFGPLLAAFALLVALISGQDPQITQLMPVLQSPLLSIHVAIIMFSYALLAMTFIISVVDIVKIIFTTPSSNLSTSRDSERGQALSQLLLYPAVMCLTIGIFIGAVWANVSWGRYWSWDSKETWALITMLIYALPLHMTLFPQKKQIRIFGKYYSFYHIYMILAFLTVLMTYFGVNYFLSGMHSYA